MSKRKKMVVFPPIEHLYLSRGPSLSTNMEGLGFHMLQKRQWGVCSARRSKIKGTRTTCPCSSRGQSKPRPGSEAWSTTAARVRGHLHDRSQRLGWRTYLGSNHHWSDPCKYTLFKFVAPYKKKLQSSSQNVFTLNMQRSCVKIVANKIIYDMN